MKVERQMDLISTSHIDVNGVKIGGSNPVVLIAGPCVIESERKTFFLAERLKEICLSIDVPLIFKASYDKANRTSMGSFRGPGLEKGLEILQKVKEDLSLLWATMV